MGFTSGNPALALRAHSLLIRAYPNWYGRDMTTVGAALNICKRAHQLRFGVVDAGFPDGSPAHYFMADFDTDDYAKMKIMAQVFFPDGTTTAWTIRLASERRPHGGSSFRM